MSLPSSISNDINESFRDETSDRKGKSTGKSVFKKLRQSISVAIPRKGKNEGISSSDDDESFGEKKSKRKKGKTAISEENESAESNIEVDDFLKALDSQFDATQERIGDGKQKSKKKKTRKSSLESLMDEEGDGAGVKTKKKKKTRKSTLETSERQADATAPEFPDGKKRKKKKKPKQAEVFHDEYGGNEPVHVEPMPSEDGMKRKKKKKKSKPMDGADSMNAVAIEDGGEGEVKPKKKKKKRSSEIPDAFPVEDLAASTRSTGKGKGKGKGKDKPKSNKKKSKRKSEFNPSLVEEVDVMADNDPKTSHQAVEKGKTEDPNPSASQIEGRCISPSNVATENTILACYTRVAVDQPVPFHLTQDDNGSILIQDIDSKFQATTGIQVGQRVLQLQEKDIASFQSLQDIQRTVQETLDLNIILMKFPDENERVKSLDTNIQSNIVETDVVAGDEGDEQKQLLVDPDLYEFETDTEGEDGEVSEGVFNDPQHGDMVFEKKSNDNDDSSFESWESDTSEKEKATREVATSHTEPQIEDKAPPAETHHDNDQSSVESDFWESDTEENGGKVPGKVAETSPTEPIPSASNHQYDNDQSSVEPDRWESDMSEKEEKKGEDIAKEPSIELTLDTSNLPVPNENDQSSVESDWESDESEARESPKEILNLIAPKSNLATMRQDNKSDILPSDTSQNEDETTDDMVESTSGEVPPKNETEPDTMETQQIENENVRIVEDLTSDLGDGHQENISISSHNSDSELDNDQDAGIVDESLGKGSLQAEIKQETVNEATEALAADICGAPMDSVDEPKQDKDQAEPKSPYATSSDNVTASEDSSSSSSSGNDSSISSNSNRSTGNKATNPGLLRSQSNAEGDIAAIDSLVAEDTDIVSKEQSMHGDDTQEKESKDVIEGGEKIGGLFSNFKRLFGSETQGDDGANHSAKNSADNEDLKSGKSSEETKSPNTVLNPTDKGNVQEAPEDDEHDPESANTTALAETKAVAASKSPELSAGDNINVEKSDESGPETNDNKSSNTRSQDTYSEESIENPLFSNVKKFFGGEAVQDNEGKRSKETELSRDTAEPSPVEDDSPPSPSQQLRGAVATAVDGCTMQSPKNHDEPSSPDENLRGAVTAVIASNTFAAEQVKGDEASDDEGHAKDNNATEPENGIAVQEVRHDEPLSPAQLLRGAITAVMTSNNFGGEHPEQMKGDEASDEEEHAKANNVTEPEKRVVVEDLQQSKNTKEDEGNARACNATDTENDILLQADPESNHSTTEEPSSLPSSPAQLLQGAVTGGMTSNTLVVEQVDAEPSSTAQLLRGAVAAVMASNNLGAASESTVEPISPVSSRHGGDAIQTEDSQATGGLLSSFRSFSEKLMSPNSLKSPSNRKLEIEKEKEEKMKLMLEHLSLDEDEIVGGAEMQEKLIREHQEETARLTQDDKYYKLDSKLDSNTHLESGSSTSVPEELAESQPDETQQHAVGQIENPFSGAAVVTIETSAATNFGTPTALPENFLEIPKAAENIGFIEDDTLKGFGTPTTLPEDFLQIPETVFIEDDTSKVFGTPTTLPKDFLQIPSVGDGRRINKKERQLEYSPGLKAGPPVEIILVDMQKQLNELHEKLNEQQRARERLEKEAEVWETKSTDQEDQLETYKGMNEDLQEDYDMVLGKYNEQVDQNAALLGIIDMMKQAASARESVLAKKVDIIRTLEEEVSALQQSSNKKQLKELKDENAKLRQMVKIQKESIQAALKGML
ncbi:unnamed protein product [Cylindrotheca closterium]|uniref:Uncharacterized protein n=1 Tax=Cylindrotheca closterium TaxID=2856 RepID=A0AAD2JJY0_9STRA|nr:unnamed protein product [Cylindrotheca closterium]